MADFLIWSGLAKAPISALAGYISDHGTTNFRQPRNLNFSMQTLHRLSQLAKTILKIQATQ